MNKQLRQFEKDSGLEIFGLGARRDLWEAALKKYAELIVRECLGIIDEEGSHEGGSIRSMEAIKEHFGVEL
jgi:hypothetical protein